MILLGRPDQKRDYNRVGFVLQAYLVIGMALGILNISLTGKDSVNKGTFVLTSYISSIFLLVSCVLTLVAGIVLHTALK
jgi:hypothetical protein